MIILTVIILIFLSILSYIGGTLFPIGIVFIAISLFCSLGISIIYLIKYLKHKEKSILIFNFLIIILSSVFGMLMNIYRTDNTSKELLEINRYVTTYYNEYGSLPMETNDYFKKFKSKVKIINEENGNYTIYYYDAIINSDDGKIHFRPRP